MSNLCVQCKYCDDKANCRYPWVMVLGEDASARAQYPAVLLRMEASQCGPSGSWWVARSNTEVTGASS
jgi:hypothetical protein